MYCLAPKEHLFMSWREQVISDDLMIIFALLDLYSASSLKQKPAGSHVASPRHIVLIPSQPVFTLTP